MQLGEPKIADAGGVVPSRVSICHERDGLPGSTRTVGILYNCLVQELNDLYMFISSKQHELIGANLPNNFYMLHLLLITRVWTILQTKSLICLGHVWG